MYRHVIQKHDLLNAACAQLLRMASVTTLSSVLIGLGSPLPRESYFQGPSSVCLAAWFLPWYPGLLSLFPSVCHQKPESSVHALGGLLSPKE